jgi:hypothetical protein
MQDDSAVGNDGAGQLRRSDDSYRSDPVKIL